MSITLITHSIISSMETSNSLSFVFRDNPNLQYPKTMSVKDFRNLYSPYIETIDMTIIHR